MSVYYVVVIVRAIAYNKYSSSVDETSRFLEIEMNKIISQEETRSDSEDWHFPFTGTQFPEPFLDDLYVFLWKLSRCLE